MFLRLLAVVHVVAFASFWVQLDGLIGPDGLLPASPYLDAVKRHLGAAAWIQLPTLCWIFGAETFLHVLCASGVLLAVLVFAGVAPGPCLLLLWAAYLSLNGAGQIFFNFQWDALLLETTLLAVFLAPWRLRPGLRPHEPPPVARFLLWWLLFRLMFFAGVVKLASGDPLWRSLTALGVHFETQPLPTIAGWYAHQLPAWLLKGACAGMFAIELFVPFFLFGPRSLRHNAALLLTGFMLAVALTGNYTFFNLLAIALCCLCFDDAWWRAVLPAGLARRIGAPPDPAKPRSVLRRIPGLIATGCVFGYTFVQSLPVLVPGVGVPPVQRALAVWVGPLRSFNNYGLFAVMTNPRPELIFEGSNDRREWLAYEFPHKPGALARAPSWVAPHQPRLDWQLWFAALGPPTQNRWVLTLCEQLLLGTPAVLGLVDHNPFPGEPPRYIRVVRYEYRFTDLETRSRTGGWWRRTPTDFHIHPGSLTR
ncbi:MAG: lipase maturation factor family protein [Opitutus sp.]